MGADWSPARPGCSWCEVVAKLMAAGPKGLSEAGPVGGRVVVLSSLADEVDGTALDLGEPLEAVPVEGVPGVESERGCEGRCHGHEKRPRRWSGAPQQFCRIRGATPV